MRNKKHVYIVVMLIIIGIALVSILGIHAGPLQVKGVKDIRFGIDIRGGVEAVMNRTTLTEFRQKRSSNLQG
jgi:preprotein translocase subunit SecD